MITTLTDEQLSRIKVSSTVGYAFEIKTTNDLYEAVTSGTWQDISSYVLEFPSIELQSETSFNNQTFASQVELTMSNVSFWKTWLSTSSTFIEFRIRETQSDFTGVIDTFTIFGGRVYKSEILFNELTDIVSITAYSYMEYANRLPAWRLDTHYYVKYPFVGASDVGALSFNSDFTFGLTSYADITSADKNFEGRFLVETDSGTSSESWNKGTPGTSQTLYDFRGSGFGQIENELFDINHELTIKYKNEGVTVTDDYPFCPFILTHHQRVIRQAMKEIGVDTDTMESQSVYIDVAPRAEGYTPIELSYIKQQNENPDLVYSTGLNMYFCVWGDTGIYYMNDDYDWIYYNVTTAKITNAIATSTSPLVGKTIYGCSVYPDYANDKIYFVWEEAYSGDSRVRASHFDITDGTYGTEIALDDSVESRYESWQLYIDSTYDYLGWLGLAGNSSGKLYLRYYDYATTTAYTSALLTFTDGGQNFYNYDHLPGMWIVSSSETNIKVCTLFQADNGSTWFYDLNTTDFDPSDLSWSDTSGTPVNVFNYGIEAVYYDHCTCNTRGVLLTSNTVTRETRSFPLSTLVTTVNSNLAYDIIIPNSANDKIIGFTSNQGYWTDLTLNYVSTNHNRSLGEPIGANSLFTSSGACKSNTADPVFNTDFALLTRYFYNGFRPIHTFIIAGEKFEPYVTRIDSSTGTVRDKLNEMCISSGISIHITDDKKLRVFKKFADNGDVVTNGDSVTILESDVINVEKIDIIEPVDYVVVSDGVDYWSSDGTNLYPVELEAFNILSVDSDMMPNNLIDSIALSRAKLVSQSFSIYQIELSYKNDRIEILDKIILSLSSYNMGLTGDGVVVGKIITEFTTILNVMVKD